MTFSWTQEYPFPPIMQALETTIFSFKLSENLKSTNPRTPTCSTIADITSLLLEIWFLLERWWGEASDCERRFGAIRFSQTYSINGWWGDVAWELKGVNHGDRWRVSIIWIYGCGLILFRWKFNQTDKQTAC